MNLDSLRKSWLLSCVLQFYIFGEYYCLYDRPVGQYPTSDKCQKPRLINGLSLMRHGGNTVIFKCSDGYRIWGVKRGTCVRGNWDLLGYFPVCVRGGCRTLTLPKNGVKVTMLGGSVTRFKCNLGYKLNGSEFLYCDGYAWNTTKPSCIPEHAVPPTTCDFETDDICGWLQDSIYDQFDWSRQEGPTPSGNVGTGPSFDHSRGHGQDGHYMFIESSYPRKRGDIAKLVSPVYPSEMSVDACFIFWYHMYGLSIGSLSVKMQLENMRSTTYQQPLMVVRGQQGNVWVKRIVKLDQVTTNFQIVLEAVTAEGYVGDTAVDDVMLANGTDCIEPITEKPTIIMGGGGDGISPQSCQGRCAASSLPPSTTSDSVSSSWWSTADVADTTPAVPAAPVIVGCACSESCVNGDVDTCCQDYATYCIAAKMSPLMSTTASSNEYRTVTVSDAPPPFPSPPPLPPLPPNPNSLTTSQGDAASTSSTPEARPTTTTARTTTTTARATTTTTRATTPTTMPTTVTTTLTTLTPTTIPTTTATTATSTKPTTTTQVTTTKRPTTIATTKTTRTARTTLTLTTKLVRKTTTTKILKPKPTLAAPIVSSTTMPSTKLVTMSTKRQSTTVQSTSSTRKPDVKKTVKPTLDSKANWIDKENVLEQPFGEGLHNSAPLTTAGWTSPPALAGLIAGLVLLLLLAVLTVVAVVRRRRAGTNTADRGHRRHGLEEDSDVRFLTADEVLDFSLARCREEEDGL